MGTIKYGRFPPQREAGKPVPDLEIRRQPRPGAPGLASETWVPQRFPQTPDMKTSCHPEQSEGSAATFAFLLSFPEGICFCPLPLLLLFSFRKEICCCPCLKFHPSRKTQKVDPNPLSPSNPQRSPFEVSMQRLVLLVALATLICAPSFAQTPVDTQPIKDLVPNGTLATSVYQPIPQELPFYKNLSPAPSSSPTAFTARRGNMSVGSASSAASPSPRITRANSLCCSTSTSLTA